MDSEDKGVIILKKKNPWRFIVFTPPKFSLLVKEYGFWQTLYGSDIFINKLPVLKSIFLIWAIYKIVIL